MAESLKVGMCYYMVLIKHMQVIQCWWKLKGERANILYPTAGIERAK